MSLKSQGRKLGPWLAPSRGHETFWLRDRARVLVPRSRFLSGARGQRRRDRDEAHGQLPQPLALRQRQGEPLALVVWQWRRQSLALAVWQRSREPLALAVRQWRWKSLAVEIRQRQGEQLALEIRQRSRE